MGLNRSGGLSAFFPESDAYSDAVGHDEPISDEKHRHARDQHRSHKEIYLPPAHDRHYRPVIRNHKREPSNRKGSHLPRAVPAPIRSERYDRYVPHPVSKVSSSTSTATYLGSSSETSTVSVNEPNETAASIINNKNTAQEGSRHSWSLREQYNADGHHHLLVRGTFEALSKTQPTPTRKPAYKVLYDPEIKKDPAKGNSTIYRINGEGLHKPRDPRQDKNYSKYLQSLKRLKKIPFRSLQLPKLTYDENSVGPAPPTEIVISGLARMTNDHYLRNQLKQVGEVLDFANILDPSTAIPLGIIRVKFGGSSIDKAANSARQAVKDLNRTTIEGQIVNVATDKEDKLLNKLKETAIKDRLAKARRIELQEKKSAKHTANKNSIRRDERDTQKQRPLREDTRLAGETQKFKVPEELDKYVKGRAFILIPSKYLKSEVEKSDIKKALELYDWTRVLYDPLGVFVVFNSPSEAKRCYQSENGKKVLSVNLYMQLHMPEGFKEDELEVPAKERDAVSEATSLLTKELESALQKDIRTKIIGPAVYEFLNIDNFPGFKNQLQPPVPPKLVSEPVADHNVVVKKLEEPEKPLDVFALHKELPKLPSFKKKASENEEHTKKQKTKSKKRILPTSHRLNFDYETEKSKETTPKLEDELDSEPPKKKSKHNSRKMYEPLLYSSSSEDEGEDSHTTSKESLPTTPEIAEDDVMDIDTKEEVEEEDETDTLGSVQVNYSNVEERYRPTATEVPVEVYEDVEGLVYDIDGVKDVVKDQEDLDLLKEIFERKMSSGNGDSNSAGVDEVVPYISWKLKNTKLINNDYKDVGILRLNSTSISARIPESLENKSGSHRSEGYTKIADEVKVKYLPHRRRVHDPLNTIQDNEENESNKIQSSRVNRANNRRFAYEVSNFNTQNEILTLNQLNKRKKPVSFARSAIHNWGLYALEPIAEREMIIEYVGERIRQQVADVREKAYLKSGIGSSYLFRVDENTVIDATKKGGIARFINHCCVPSCTAKIIKVEGQKRIVIYALRDIGANEELTYDYKFERETNDNERVRCLCGAPGCKGYLN